MLPDTEVITLRKIEGYDDWRKQCFECERSLHPNEFNWRANKTDGRQRICRDCVRWRNLLYNYGITRADYEALLAKQSGACAICCKTLLRGKASHVDHDHACHPGKRGCPSCVRGLLCVTCNTGLGSFRDNPDLLVAASEYLNTWNSAGKAA